MFRHREVQMFGLKLLQIGIFFHSREVVNRGSETQLQVVENVFSLVWRYQS